MTQRAPFRPTVRPGRMLLVAAIAIALGSQRAPAQAAGHSHDPAPETAARFAPPPDEDAFLRAARTGTERYRDIANARADGYRRVGSELPSLGEHWVHNGRALADRLDPARPPILVYATVDGRPTLAGVAYTRFLAPGEAYPAFPSSSLHAWHDHNGGVDDEVLPLGHLASGTAAPAPSSTTRLRIAVMHAWIGVENPAGVWTSENWGLAYARVGLAPAAGPGGADARALSLITGADAYYLRAMASLGALDDRELAHARQALATHAARVRVRVDALGQKNAGRPRALEASDVLALAAEWNALWQDVLAGVRPLTAERLKPLIEALGGAKGAPSVHPPNP